MLQTDPAVVYLQCDYHMSIFYGAMMCLIQRIQRFVRRVTADDVATVRVGLWHYASVLENTDRDSLTNKRLTTVKKSM